MNVAFILLAGSMLLSSGTAVAMEGHGQDRKHHAEHAKHSSDAQMALLHKMMPRYAQAQVSIYAAMEKGDLKAVAKETAYLLSTTADLQKAKPHKNLAALEEFRAIAAGFEQDVKMTAIYARKEDLARTKTAFAGALKRCDTCHAKFRD